MSAKDSYETNRTKIGLAVRNLAIAEDLRIGMSKTNAGKKYGLSRAQIWRIAGKHGLVRRNITDAQRKKRNLEIIQEVKSGLSITQVARKFGIHYFTVYRVCRAAGIPLKNGKPGRTQSLDYDYQHPAYLQARKESFQRSNGICQFCGRYPAVHAHHWTYPSPENTRARHLTALCSSCHGLAGKQQKAL